MTRMTRTFISAALAVAAIAAGSPAGPSEAMHPLATVRPIDPQVQTFDVLPFTAQVTAHGLAFGAFGQLVPQPNPCRTCAPLTVQSALLEARPVGLPMDDGGYVTIKVLPNGSGVVMFRPIPNPCVECGQSALNVISGMVTVRVSDTREFTYTVVKGRVTFTPHGTALMGAGALSAGGPQLDAIPIYTVSGTVFQPVYRVHCLYRIPPTPQPNCPAPTSIGLVPAPGARVIAQTPTALSWAMTDASGHFALQAPANATWLWAELRMVTCQASSGQFILGNYTSAKMPLALTHNMTVTLVTNSCVPASGV